MYEVVDKNNRRILFANKADADNYVDYMHYGLKVIRVQGRTYYFNNGDRLIDASYLGKKIYVLKTRTGERITSEKLQKRHIAVI